VNDSGIVSINQENNMENWELVYLSVFRCFSAEDSNVKEIEEMVCLTEFSEEHDELMEFLGGLISQSIKKKESLSPNASCRCFQFADSDKGQSDARICDELLNAVSKGVFQSHASLLANQYLKTPKSRDGILFVINANVSTKKARMPFVLVLKTDHQSGSIMDPTGELQQRNDVILPELKKSLVYPHFDGMNPDLNKVKIFQKSSSDYFQQLLALSELPDAHQIAEEALWEELSEKHPGAYDRYFQNQDEDRKKKRDIFGEARLVEETDLLDPDEITHVSMKTQMKNMDKNASPIRLRVQVDDGIRFDGRMDQLNKTYFFARNGLEKVLVVRGNTFSTKSHFQTVEFMQLQTLDEVLKKMGAEPLSSGMSQSPEMEILPPSSDWDDMDE
jgi:hypothetical protein